MKKKGMKEKMDKSKSEKEMKHMDEPQDKKLIKKMVKKKDLK